MAFSFLKKKSPLANLFGGGKSSGKKSSKGDKLKGELAGQGYDKASKDLEPKEKGTGKAPDARSFFGKLDDKLGLGQSMRSNDWCKRRWKDVHSRIDTFDVASVRANYRDELMAFLVADHSDEQLLALEAFDMGASNQEIYETFVSNKAPHQLNMSGKARKVLTEQAEKGEYDKMVLTRVRECAKTDLQDEPLKRFFESDILCKRVFEQLTSQDAPDKVGGGYS